MSCKKSRNFALDGKLWEFEFCDLFKGAVDFELVANMGLF